MKLFYFLFLILISFKSYSATEPTGRVGLEEAKKHAIEHNLEVLGLRHELEEKRALSGVARSAFFPKLGVAGGAESTQGGREVILGYVYGSYNIFHGFEDTYRYQISSVDWELSEIKLQQATWNVGLEVESQFHLYLFKKNIIDLKNKAIELNNTHKKAAEKRRASGMSVSSDVMEFELRESLLKSDLLLLNQELQEVRISLRRLLGEEVGSKIEPVGNLQHQHLKGTLTDYVQKLKEHSTSVRLANRELARTTLESRVWRSKWLPSLDLETQAGYLSIDDRPAAGGLGFKGTIIAKFDIFNGFGSVSEKNAGQSKRLKSEAELKRAIQTVLADTETSFRRLKTIQDRVDIEEKNEGRAKRYYDAVFNEYKRGVKNSADVKVAAEVFFEARMRSETFKYDFLKERLALEKASGAKIETEMIQE